MVIWGDDIGISNLSCYSEGLMGYRTPNIDRIAAEGMRFTDSYGEQSCTAGRSSFGKCLHLKPPSTLSTRASGAEDTSSPDDAEREFDYTAGAEDSLARAADKGWTVININNDWSKVFAD